LLITSGPEPYIETGPLPPFEAIASGIPVIGTNVGNFRKIPGPKFTTTDEAAAIIRVLKSDPAQVRSLAEEQYNWVVENWTYKTLASSWKHMFNVAIASQHASQ
jgi:glycosyltransferase involved in cell wall biosynthesis